MTDLPPGWAEVTIGDVCEVVGGATPKTKVAEYWGGDVAWLTPDDMSRHHGKYIAHGARSLTDQGYDSCSATMVPKGTVLFTSRAPIGYVAIAQAPVCTNQGFKSFVPPEGVLSDYLYWYLRYTTPDIRDMGSGTTFKEISKRVAASIPLRLPPLAEQRRIVDAIEEHLTRIDSADQDVASAVARLGRYRMSILQSRIRGDWPILPLGNLGEVFVGSTPSRADPSLWGGPVPWVSSGEVAFCRISETAETISKDAVREDRIHPPGTVMLGMIGEGKTRGQAAILDVPAAHNQNSAAIRLDPEKALPEWLYLVLLAQYEATRQAGSGGNQPALNKARVKALPVPTPPVEVQRVVVEQLDRLMAQIGRAASALESVAARSVALRQSVLAEAFCGRLLPQDPDDEPASRLVDRISRDRATQHARPKKEAGRVTS